ncbi:MAG: UxaA family hydrolase [Candidatus Fimivivens sp.]
MKKFIILNQKDNVATALTALSVGEVVENVCHISPITIKNDVMFEHKFALCDIKKGERVYKYGVAIGIAYKNIQAGEHVHLHNLKSLMVDGVETDPHILESEWGNRI